MVESIEFRLGKHELGSGNTIIEVWERENFIAHICPTETGVKIVPKNISMDPQKMVEFGPERMPLIREILIHLKNK